jgi:glycosyltransferase involved in cell wall biosynthesis
MLGIKEHVLIITPDLFGLVNNGGIGTYVYELSILLSQEYHVHLITSVPGRKGKWRAIYEELNVEVTTIDEIKKEYPYLLGVDQDDQDSYLIFNYLRNLDKEFKLIFLQDWKALGFHIVRAKKMGLAFENSYIATVFHSPSLWSTLGSDQWSSNWRKDEFGAVMNARLNYREKYQIQNSDEIIFPSLYMKEWAHENGYSFGNKETVLTNPYTPDFHEEIKDVTPKGVAFFGRLEKRKGLDIFLDALEICQNRGLDLGRIVFLGKYGVLDNVSAFDLLRDFKLRTGIQIEVYDDLSSKNALIFLKKNALLAVHPSRRDNLPYGVIEALAEKIPILVSNVGGTESLVPSSLKFSLDAKDLASNISENLQRKLPQLVADYRWEEKNIAYLQWVKSVFNSSSSLHDRDSSPLVSILVPYFNTGDFIEESLASIEKQVYFNFEVIIANCASTDARSISKFNDLKLEYAENEKYQFLEFPTCPVQIAKNDLAKIAKGDYLVFLDSDNLFLGQDSLGTLVECAEYSSTDFITAGHIGFSSPKAPSKVSPFHEIWLPLGQNIHLAWYENVFGDTFGICKRTSFLDSGGYLRDINFYEDWAFYLEISKMGYSLDVIPLPLMWYRHRKQSRRMITKEFETRVQLLETYENTLPKPLKGIFVSSLAAFIFQESPLVRTSGKEIVSALERIANRYLPRGTRRRKILIDIIFKLSSS